MLHADPRAVTARTIAGAAVMMTLAALPAAAVPAKESRAPLPPSLEEILSLNTFGAATWSNDGRRLAFVVNHPDTADNSTQAEIWLWEAGADTARRLTRYARPDLSPTFSPGGDTLAFISTRGSGEPKPAIWMMSLRGGGDPWSFGTFDEGLSEVQWSPDGRTLAYVEIDTLPKRVAEWRKKRWDPTVENERLQYPRLWTLEIATGKKRRLTTGAQYVWYVRWSPDSKRIACLTSPTGRPDDGNRTDIAIFTADGGDARKLGVIGSAFAWSPDGRSIAWAAGADTALQVQKSELWIAPIAGGGKPVALTADFDGEAEAPCWSAGSDTVHFHAAIGVTSMLASASVRTRHVVLSTDRRGEAGAMTASRAGRVAWVESHADRPDELHVADHPRLAGRAVTGLHAHFARRACSIPVTVSWTSDDGTKVEGLLFRPVGARPDAALPTLVQLHGGPYGDRGTIGFQTWAQYFASQGYQLFFPNFRSSGGYGTAFMLRKRSDWGQQDWRDVQSGIDSLVRRGLADGNRLGVFGRSYGGYLSAWAITQTRRFDACVTIATIVNLPALFGQSDIKKYRAFEFEGRPWETPENWKRSSPMTYIENVRTPTMIVGFDEDARTPLAQARELHAALETLGVPNAFVHYPREPHTPREYRHRLDMFLRMKAWFDRWIH